ncbi:hypothetical protein DICVIV_08283 [Dictyocaulus viviparus]|uniref:SUEL-type lectin domain-containing protein n=1 Tax=Dictyocaulus viviparus TaxID=29172 RepID=A0A0D8XPI0_DICVI|nr:hypothetical protein DICVIV_08283 [Dictyocaulus viviparus]
MRTEEEKCFKLEIRTFEVVELKSYSIVVCEGGTAELVCPLGTVIIIVLANYGRYSARVCYENEDLDDVVPMAQCHNPKTMPTLRRRFGSFFSLAVQA